MGTITYAPFWVEWLFVSVPGGLTLAVGVLAVLGLRSRTGPFRVLSLGIVNLVTQFAVLWFLILPVKVGAKTCGSAMSCARLRSLPGEALTPYDIACHSGGVRVVAVALSMGIAVALACGWLLARRLKQPAAG